MIVNIDHIPLTQLPIGQKAYVSKLLSDGDTRRRMLDLGIIDGTEIEPLYKSPSGNPIAYAIRGAVIALRADVSKNIVVSVLL
ncbi:ferrous iron transport protein A [Oscillospiraceae bacterium CM]|nr:ferrous iron transport protein A [Oscillospiraceae bacterium CM]